jgi:hypothetical protein
MEAMNWLRNNEVKPGDVDGTCFEHLRRFPAFRCRINMSAAEKKKATDDAMSWLRNNDPNLDDVDFRLPRRLETCWCEDARCDPVAEGKGPRYG